MKCLTSFLLAVLCVNLINSIPSTDEDYLEAVKDVKYLFGEGSGHIEPEEVPRSSTPSEELTSSLSLGSIVDGFVGLYDATTEDISTSTTETISTTTPEDLSMYTKNNLLRILSTRVNDLQMQFIEQQQEIFDKSKSSRDEHEISSFTYINLFQNKYDKEVNELNEKIRRLESKRSEIETSIQEYLMNETENVEKLKTRKKMLQSFKDQGCDECHGFLDDNAIDEELKNIDKKIGKLENKADAIRDQKEPLDTKEMQALNSKYVELIQIYEKEIQERKKKEHFELINKMIQEKLMNYTEVIEQNFKEELISRQNFAENFLDIRKLQLSTIDQSDNDAEENTGACPTKHFEWRSFENRADTEKNGVLAGVDLDGSELYVIRRKSGTPKLYGKVALRPSRNDAYVTKDSSEIAVDDVDILVSKNFKWLSSNKNRIVDVMPPICRAKKDNLFVPGTVLEDGRCRIGFGFGIIMFDNNFEILTFPSCKKFDLKSVKKWY
ncbi:unnamed protein product [Chironomus riparius]|uniref:Uncharacterized protein n=1 Tax=Chironomus riparius TaxID=315576 RepID=A0A9N9S5F3_9DIPT|nr:unnamed protein product [Chironomus riparius]